MTCPVITLTTDFGAESPYVAQMKASILSINQNAVIVDITHSVPPQNIEHAAIVLLDTVPRFPSGTVHVAVVDPEVGTARPILLARFGHQLVIAPDNGLLGGLAMADEPTLLFTLTNRKLWNQCVSRTFHGRDIMAPVAAHLSRGTSPADVGPAASSYHKPNWPQPVIQADSVAGTVVMIDSFGNLITDIRAAWLSRFDQDRCVVRYADREVVGIRSTYGEQPPGSLIALPGSSDRLELAVVCGNAARTLGARTGEPVVVCVGHAS